MLCSANELFLLAQSYCYCYSIFNSVYIYDQSKRFGDWEYGVCRNSNTVPIHITIYIIYEKLLSAIITEMID